MPPSCLLALLSLGERGRSGHLLVARAGVPWAGGDQTVLGPEGGGRGSEGGLGRPEGRPGTRSGGDWEDWSLDWRSLRLELRNWEALGA